MKYLIAMVLVGISVVMVGCDSKGTPVAFASTCDKANDDARIETTGYFNNTGSAMCSKSGNGPMRCPINFVETPGKEDGIVRAEIDLGAGASSIEDVKGKGLTIHDDKNEVIDNNQKVKIVADVNVLDTPREDKKLQNCWVVVKKIEKAQ
ncbi:MAG: hypothetical protein R2684_02080 [Pyrinomonadaceae bacterium]